MAEKIRSFVWLIMHRFLYILGQLVTYIVDTIIHPLNNISFWIVVALFLSINKADIYRLSGKEMFLFSAGLVTILTFIVTFLQSVTVNSRDKENYYLGYNLLKRNFYDNFWMKRFNEMHIKLYLWILVIIPGLKIFSNYHYKYDMLNNVSDYLKQMINNLYYFWISIVVVICIYCAAILIESINLTKNTFSRSNAYQSDNRYEKSKIRRAIKKDFKREFDKVLKVKIGYLFDFYNNEELGNVRDLTDYIIKRAQEVTNSEEEHKEYIDCVYFNEHLDIEEIFTKIAKIILLIGKNKKESYTLKIYLFILNKYLKKIRGYYIEKWKSIEQSNFCERSKSMLSKIANWDLLKLYDLEHQFINQSEELYKKYNDTFRGFYPNSCFDTFNNEIKNICISMIVGYLNKMFDNSKLYERLEYKKDIYTILQTLNYIDNINENNNYVSEVFEVLFNQALENEHRGSIYLEFNKQLSCKYCDKFILDQAKRNSYRELMKGIDYSTLQLKFMLDFQNFRDTIIVLIFRLAYAERSHRKYMLKDEFNIWKHRLYQLSFDEDLNDLNNNKFIDELRNKIGESCVSHFVFDSFLKWLWDSLFDDFDSKKYQEFKELGEKGIRRDFGLCSYIILRRLLLENIYDNYQFSVSDREEIQKELSNIKDILDFYY